MFSDREARLLQRLRSRAAPLRAWLAMSALPLLLGLHAASAASAGIDLDRFDASKQTVALPDGERLAYAAVGNPAGEPVVLIHGYSDSARDWVPLLPYLSSRLRLIVVDIRGHGRSGKPECCYTRFDFAYDIKLLLDALAVPRSDIVGHSLGSVITQTFAELWPERTRRVVLISSTGGLPLGAAPPQALTNMIAQIRRLREPIEPDSPFMMEWWSSPTPVDAEFERRGRLDSAAIPVRVWLAVLDQVIEAEFESRGLQRMLPRLTAPALLIWGGRDPLIGEPSRTLLREALPQAQVKVFPGLGHNPMWEDPRGCAELINAFLSAASAGAAVH